MQYQRSTQPGGMSFLQWPSLKRILILACLARLIAAIFSTGFFHADEHFQVLEPAHHLAYGDWVPTWEWSRGMRSWFLPGIYGAVLIIFKWTGFENPHGVSIAMRMFSGALSLIGVWATYRV